MSNERLIQLAAALLEPQMPFERGALVEWKDGLADQNIEGGMVVAGTLNTAHRNYSRGQVHYADVADLVVVCLNQEGGVYEALVDSRRLCLSA